MINMNSSYAIINLHSSALGTIIIYFTGWCLGFTLLEYTTKAPEKLSMLKSEKKRGITVMFNFYY